MDRLDILINNAGIGTAGPRQTSAEGFELRFAVNYLAGFLLTLLLLPLIKNSAPARIVNVSSAGQQPIDFGDVMLTRGYMGLRERPYLLLSRTPRPRTERPEPGRESASASRQLGYLSPEASLSAMLGAQAAGEGLVCLEGAKVLDA